MGYASTLAICLLVAFMFYIVDAVTKMSADVRLVASYVKQQQQRRTASSKAVAAAAVGSMPSSS